MPSPLLHVVAAVSLLVEPLASTAPCSDLSPGTPAESAIVIVIDDVGWEDLALVPTPTLDAVGVLGRTYCRTYASCVCSPSRYQLIFGRYPSHEFVGAALGSKNVKPEDVGASVQTTSIATPLRAAGVRTAAFGKWHVNNKLGGAQLESARRHGFETWRAGMVGNLTGAEEHFNWTRVDDGTKSNETDYTTVAIESELRQWWTDTPGRKFAYVAFAAAHAPHQPAPAELLPPGYFVGFGQRKWFESAIVGLDTALARLGEYVDFERTAVFVVCDNGTAQDVPPPGALFKGYKLTQYEGGVRVPLLAIGAGIQPGCDTSLVQVVDLPRTVLDVLAVNPKVGFEDSISFAPTLDGGAVGERRWAFVQKFAPNGGLAPVLNKDDWAVVWADGWKVLVQDGSAEQVYDLNVDFTETTDLAQTALGAARVVQALALRAEILGDSWPY